MLGKKQFEDNRIFQHTWENIEGIISKAHVKKKLYNTLSEMRQVLRGNLRFGNAWSGGKDSVVVDLLCKMLEKPYQSCIGMTDELEFPEFMKFVTDNMPPDLIVYNSGHTLEWLSKNQRYLFPKDSATATYWFKTIQHKAQNRFFKDQKLDVLLTGRRLKDTNYCGKNGLYKNKSSGVVRYSPIYQWSHEEVLATIKYYNLPLAPFYKWPNGWVVGSGCWAARQWTGSVSQGWADIYEIDPSVVHDAAKYIKSANDYVRNLGI